jgi:hypothetical protein
LADAAWEANGVRIAWWIAGPAPRNNVGATKIPGSANTCARARDLGVWKPAICRDQLAISIIGIVIAQLGEAPLEVLDQFMVATRFVVRPHRQSEEKSHDSQF